MKLSVLFFKKHTAIKIWVLIWIIKIGKIFLF